VVVAVVVMVMLAVMEQEPLLLLSPVASLKGSI
jgi:hypothetical protein